MKHKSGAAGLADFKNKMLDESDLEMVIGGAAVPVVNGEIMFAAAKYAVGVKVRFTYNVNDKSAAEGVGFIESHNIGKYPIEYMIRLDADPVSGKGKHSLMYISIIEEQIIEVAA